MIIKNRRHIYTLFSKEDGCFPILENIDNFIRNSLKLDLHSEKIIIYCEDLSEGVLMLGREVVGFDVNIKGSEALETRDYQLNEFESIGASELSKWDELRNKIKSFEGEFKALRFEFEQNDISKCKIYAKR